MPVLAMGLAAVAPAPTALPDNTSTMNTTLPVPSQFGNVSNLPHDSKQGAIIASAIITLMIAAAFVVARFYTKIVINRSRLGYSEWLVFASWVFSLATTIPEILEITYGNGAHIYDLTQQSYNPVGIAEAQWVSIIFYSLSLTFSKLSILILYIQIFFHTWIRKLSFAILAAVSLSQVWVLYVIFSACTPLEAFWDLSISPAQCHPQTYFLSNQYLLITTDFLIFLLPIPVVWTLRVGARQKCLLFFLFALGFFVCAISVIRIVLLMPLLANGGPDATYNSALAYYWTFVETNLAIVVACAITLKPFISRFMPKTISSRLNKNSDRLGSPNGHTVASSRHGLLRNPLATFGSVPTRNQHGANAADDDDTTQLQTLQRWSASSSSVVDASDKPALLDKIDEETLGSPEPHNGDTQPRSPTENAPHAPPTTANDQSRKE